MKLSEQLLEIEDVLRDKDVMVPPGLYSARARQLESELTGYREAIAEIHKLFGEEWVHADSLADILDRLPRGDA